MSKSRSTTPIPNTSSSTTNPAIQSTSSRHPHESLPTSSRVDEPTLRFRSPVPSAGQASHSTTRRRRRSDSPSPEQPMAKRLRRHSDSRQSSPSSDSQSAMADSEDPGHGKTTERAPSGTAAPKKKRTRTLTTPHQSTVLHALLAQVI